MQQPYTKQAKREKSVKTGKITGCQSDKDDSYTIGLCFQFYLWDKK